MGTCILGRKLVSGYIINVSIKYSAGLSSERWSDFTYTFNITVKNDGTCTTNFTKQQNRATFQDANYWPSARLVSFTINSVTRI